MIGYEMYDDETQIDVLFYDNERWEGNYVIKRFSSTEFIFLNSPAPGINPFNYSFEASIYIEFPTTDYYYLKLFSTGTAEIIFMGR
ncbi:MAG: hypothetical protein ACK52J_03870 [bacterium]|jgi:hypothetical protein